MNSLKQNFSNFFSHIYIEKQVFSSPVTIKFLERYNNIGRTYIDKYTDIFNRRAQNFSVQKQAPAVILAKKDENLIYPGARMCQSFGYEYFYYTSSIMNCIYDCEYCYLQGMYSSANIVIFVNIEDIFDEIKKLLCSHPVYLCISYDTDLLALEGILGYCQKWLNFVYDNEGLTVELRTKAPLNSNLQKLLSNKACDRFIFAFTLSPDIIIKNFEHKTGSLSERISAAKAVINSGFSVRLCFDPIIYMPDFENIYAKFIKEVFEYLPKTQINDISIGTFRIAETYLKHMRKNRPSSPLLQFPYICENGVCCYDKKLSEEIIIFMKTELKKYISLDKLFVW